MLVRQSENGESHILESRISFADLFVTSKTENLTGVARCENRQNSKLILCSGSSGGVALLEK